MTRKELEAKIILVPKSFTPAVWSPPTGEITKHWWEIKDD